MASEMRRVLVCALDNQYQYIKYIIIIMIMMIMIQ